MRPPSVRLGAAAREAAERVLSSPERVAALLGEGGDLEEGADGRDLVSRIRGVFEMIEGHIPVVVANAEEIGDPEYRTQAEGEVIASLIVLRELWLAVPELRGEGG